MSIKLPKPIQKPVAVEMRVFGVVAANIELLDKKGVRIGIASVHLKEDEIPKATRDMLEKAILAKQLKEDNKAKANQNKEKEK